MRDTIRKILILFCALGASFLFCPQRETKVDALLEQAQPDEIEYLKTNDEYSGNQWAFYDPLANIHAEEAWAMGKGENQETIVAIIDTGIDYLHADLAEAMWKNTDEIEGSTVDNDNNGYAGDYYGWNFIDDNGEICAYQYSNLNKAFVDYHGTHVAGIIGAKPDNGVGITGLAGYANIKIMSLKIMDADHSGELSNLIKAIQYAEENGAKICNISLGTEIYNQELYDVMKNSSMLFVCAAGNGDSESDNLGYDLSERPMFPACYELDNIISVANANDTLELDSSSCYGEDDVDIAAPGTNIASTYVDSDHSTKGKYIVLTGTSMAAPYVTATAAMLNSYYGDLSALRMKQMILEGSRKVSSNITQVANGAYLDVYSAMNYTKVLTDIKLKVKKVSKSKQKKLVITADDICNEGLELYYAKGKKSLAYFEEGNGKALRVSNGKAVITVKKTGTYTIYAKNSFGKDKIIRKKVTVSS